MKTEIERRFTVNPPAAPVRLMRSTSGGAMAVGYASVFYNANKPGTEYQLAKDVFERIAPTAFDRAIREKHNAAGLLNHNTDLLLGRVSSGTMRLSVDNVGLRYEIDLADTSVGRDTRIHLERGDITGSSFGFIALDDVVRKEGDRYIREVRDLQLIDCSPVVFAAYAGASAGIAIGDEGRDVTDPIQKSGQGSPTPPAIAARIAQLMRDRVAEVQRIEIDTVMRRVEADERKRVANLGSFNR